MPFKSEKQRRFMWSQHPRIARRWADEEKAMKAKKKKARKEALSRIAK